MVRDGSSELLGFGDGRITLFEGLGVVLTQLMIIHMQKATTDTFTYSSILVLEVLIKFMTS